MLALAASGLATSILGALTAAFDRYRRRNRPQEAKDTYAARVETLTLALRQSAGAAASLASEMELVIAQRATDLTYAQERISELEAQESELAERLANLNALRPDSLRVFEDAMDRRLGRSDQSARAFFFWGILATVLVGTLGLWIAPMVS